MTSPFQGILDAITRVRGVRGAMIVSRDDGLVIAEALMEGVRGNAVAALAASVAKRIGNVTVSAGAGGLLFFHMQATDGVLLAVPAGVEILVVAIAEPAVNVGLVRLELLRAAEAVA